MQLTLPVPPAHAPDARELMEEVLLNKQVLQSFDELLRPAVADITRVMELTGQPVTERKATEKRLRRRTLAVLKELNTLIPAICTAGTPSVEQGRPCTSAEMRALLAASRSLERLGKRIDVVLNHYLALWQGRACGTESTTPSRNSFLNGIRPQ